MDGKQKEIEIRVFKGKPLEKGWGMERFKKFKTKGGDPLEPYTTIQNTKTKVCT